MLSSDTPPPSRAIINLFDGRGLFFFGGDLRFDFHVAEFARIEDLAAFEALHEFRIFVARYHLDSRMKTLLRHGLALGVAVGCVRRLDVIHNAWPEPLGQL